MKEIGKRLKQARIACGIKSATEAAESLGVKYSTYSAHERGTEGFKLDEAIKYARRFKISLDWLITAKGRGPSSTNNRAWEIYLELVDLDGEDLDFIKSSIDYIKSDKA